MKVCVQWNPVYVKIGTYVLTIVAGLFGFSFLTCILSLCFISISLGDRYKLKYCLKGSLTSKQPTNKLNFDMTLFIVM